MDNDNQKRKCTRCKVSLPIESNFEKSRSGEYYKQCNQCREKRRIYSREYKKKYKCEHNKRKDRCRECKQLGIGGGSICDHNKRRTRCRECKENSIGGSELCDHYIRKEQCDKCYIDVKPYLQNKFFNPYIRDNLDQIDECPFCGITNCNCGSGY